MIDKEAEKLLYRTQWLNHNIVDIEDAICFAMDTVPKIDQNTWFGEINDSDESVLGTFYLSATPGGQCRWFDLLDAQSASRFIVKELEVDLA